MAETITDTNIEKLRELAHKDSVNECVEWLIKHYQMVGEGVIKLQDENEKLKNEIAEYHEANGGLKEDNDDIRERMKLLKNELDGIYKSNEKKNVEYSKLIKTYEELKKERCNLLKSNEYLKKENEELKESLRSITAMDKEEPCERIESLIEDVQRLTTENGKLEDLNRELSQNLEERNLKSKMLEKDYMELRLNMAGIRGELIAYKYVISQMFAKK